MDDLGKKIRAGVTKIIDSVTCDIEKYVDKAIADGVEFVELGKDGEYFGGEDCTLHSCSLDVLYRDPETGEGKCAIYRGHGIRLKKK